MRPITIPQPLITTPIATTPGTGRHSVQVLRTYGITSAFLGYSWSPRGEFSAWTSYINAIKRASSYIYIEDQYFLPFDWPPCFARTGAGGTSTAARDTDVIYQLGEAIKRGVRVAIVTPNNSEDPFWWSIKYQRDVGANYLLGIKAAGAPGDVVVAALNNGTEDIYVHSKLMIIDDEVLFIGSTNVGQRSMTFDAELHLAVVDADNLLAKDYRKRIWEEHTGVPASALDSPVTAYDTYFKPYTAGSLGHLTPYDYDAGAFYPGGTTAPPWLHARALKTGIDPYAGPPGIR
jgi:hypothetical protein